MPPDEGGSQSSQEASPWGARDHRERFDSDDEPCVPLCFVYSQLIVYNRPFGRCSRHTPTFPHLDLSLGLLALGVAVRWWVAVLQGSGRCRGHQPASWWMRETVLFRQLLRGSPQAALVESSLAFGTLIGVCFGKGAVLPWVLSQAAEPNVEPLRYVDSDSLARPTSGPYLLPRLLRSAPQTLLPRSIGRPGGRRFEPCLGYRFEVDSSSRS